jgi:hypothetical protein
MDAEQIVRALANDDPMCGRLNGELCAHCGAHAEPYGEEAHSSDCVWRLAQEWIAAQASTDTSSSAPR